VKDFRGNFVIIKHHDKEYSFIAHFRLDSINVKKGQKVIQGQVIGLCGNSGHSTEPHIHFHLQDSANFWIATGLPIKFTKFEALTNESVPELKLNSFIEKNESVTNV
jgi:murein DD-endopeptidase MepM/ murein hydrolase activator NlpD